MSENRTLIGNISYKLTEQDKAEITEKVKESLQSEEWVFKLQDGSTVMKKVVLK